MMDIYIIVSALVLLGLSSRAQGIRCYECSSNSLNKNPFCETGLSETSPVSCPVSTRFCDFLKVRVNLQLLEYNMVYRSCGDNSSWLRQNIAIDKTFTVITLSYRSCNTNLCNGDLWDKSSLYTSSEGSFILAGRLTLFASVILGFFGFY